MRLNWSAIGRIVAAAALLYVALFVWPTPYKEYQIGNRIIRVNRVTGSQQLLTADGWQ
jgi:hypothetical protein